MPAAKRETCSICGRDVAVKADGKPYQHGWGPDQWAGFSCPGDVYPASTAAETLINR